MDITFTYAVDRDVALSMVELRDADALFELVDSSRDYLREWLPWVDETKTPDETRSWIKSALDQHARNEALHCRIIYRGESAGVVGIHRIDWSNSIGELGYWLGQRYQGQGIMTKGCRAMTDYAFSELGLNRVEIWAAEANARSRAIPERLGFALEGVLRDAEKLHDRYVDSVVYGMLQRDWTTA